MIDIVEYNCFDKKGNFIGVACIKPYGGYGFVKITEPADENGVFNINLLRNKKKAIKHLKTKYHKIIKI